jgi:hypothetical protein
LAQIKAFNNWLQQLSVDLTQSLHANLFPKAVHHPHAWNVFLIGQVGKATPGFLFGKHPDEEIKGMNRSDQDQQVQSE